MLYSISSLKSVKSRHSLELGRSTLIERNGVLLILEMILELWLRLLLASHVEQIIPSIPKVVIFE